MSSVDPHINGRYAIIVALIALIGTFGKEIIKHCLNKPSGEHIDILISSFPVSEVPSASALSPEPEGPLPKPKVVISKEIRDIFKDAAFQKADGQYSSACRKYIRAFKMIDFSENPIVKKRLENAMALSDESDWLEASEEFKKIYTLYLTP